MPGPLSISKQSQLDFKQHRHMKIRHNGSVKYLCVHNLDILFYPSILSFNLSFYWNFLGSEIA